MTCLSPPRDMNDEGFERRVEKRDGGQQTMHKREGPSPAFRIGELVNRVAIPLAVAALLLAPPAVPSEGSDLSRAPLDETAGLFPGNGPLVVGPPPASLTTTSVNFDGTTWLVAYPSTILGEPGIPIHDLGRALAEGAASVYGEQVHHGISSCAGAVNPAANWGFRHRDDDCEIKIDVGWYPAGICNAHPVGPPGDLRIDVGPILRECLYALGYYRDPGFTTRSFARSVVGHEFFHILQLQNGGGAFWNAYDEATARFIQTLLEPAFEAQASSLWYGLDGSTTAGVNYLTRHPEIAMCSHSYDYALYWGYLYGHDGGMDLIRRVVQTIGSAGGLDCNVRLAQVIDGVLAEIPGGHATHAAALADFAINLYEGDFSWAPPRGGMPTDFGAHLLAVKRENQGLETTERTVGAWGMQYVQLPGEGVYDVSVTLGDSSWVTRLFLKADDDSLTIVPMVAGAPVAVDGSAHAEVVFQAVRTAAGSGQYTLTTAPA